MLRDRLQGRRVLFVLDDAAGPDQVRPLLSLPAGNSALITSRETLAALVDRTQVRLGALSRSDAVLMLAMFLGTGKVQHDPAATERLVTLCTGLPLAIRIAAARLADRPAWSVTDLADRLSDERQRLSEMEAGDLGVRGSLQLSHDLLARSERPLDRAAANLVTWLPLLHTSDLTADVVAALAALPENETRSALERLVDAHLLETHMYGRYRLHDLIRLYTHRRLLESHDEASRDEALLRALSYYIATTERAVRLADPHRAQLPIPKVAATPHVFAGEEAVEWLDDEHDNLVAAASQAMRSSVDDIARLGIGLAFALWWCLYKRVDRTDTLSLSQSALDAAQRLADPYLLAHAHGMYASALHYYDRFSECIPHWETELHMHRQLGETFSEMRALGNLSAVCIRMGRYEDALRDAGEQLELARKIGADVGERHALNMIARAHRGLGDFTLATQALEETLARAREAGDAFHVAHNLGELFNLYLEQKQLERARVCLKEILSLQRKMRHRAGELDSMIDMVHVCRLLGELDEAKTYLREVLELTEDDTSKRWQDRIAEERVALDAALADAEDVRARRGPEHDA
jgi:tetratricopeptide (TPR) repeat protein